jgi:hypothetical protein
MGLAVEGGLASCRCVVVVKFLFLVTTEPPNAEIQPPRHRGTEKAEELLIVDY